VIGEVSSVAAVADEFCYCKILNRLAVALIVPLATKASYSA